MARRFQIEDPNQQARLQPVASPVSTFAPPAIQAPELQNIVDLAPLSKTFGALASSIAGGLAEETYKAGGVAFTQNKDDIKQAMLGGEKSAADKLAALARANKIPEHYIPQFYRGIYELGARDLLRSYRTDLDLELDKYSQVEDQDGKLMPEPSESVDAVAARVWRDKYATSPIFTNFFGQQEAAKYKSEIDGDWASKAVEARAASLKKWRQTKLGGEIGSLVRMAAMDSEKGSPMLEAAITEARNLGIPNIQKFVMSSGIDQVKALSSKAKVTNSLPEREKLYTEARMVLNTLEDLKFGDAVLGDSVENQADLAEAREFVEASAYQSLELQQRQRTQELGKAGYDLIGGIPDDLKADAAGRIAWAQQQVIKQYPDDLQMQAAALETFAKASALFTPAIISDAKTVNAVQVLIAQGELDQATSMFDVALSDGRISGEDGVRLRRMINETAVSQRNLMESKEATSAETSLNTRWQSLDAMTRGTEASTEFAQSILRLKGQFTTELTEAVSANLNNPVEAKKQIDSIKAKYTAEADKLESSFTDKKSKAKEALRKWQFNELTLSGEEIQELAKSLTKSEMDSFELMNREYNTVPQDVKSDPNINVIESQIKRAVFGIASTRGAADQMSAQDVLSTDPELSSLLTILDNVQADTIRTAWQEGLKNGVNRSDLKVLIANKVKEATKAAIGESSIKDATKAAMFNTLDPKSNYRVLTGQDINVMSAAASMANSEFLESEGKIPSSIRRVASTMTSQTGVSISVDANAFYEALSKLSENAYENDWAIDQVQEFRRVKGQPLPFGTVPTEPGIYYDPHWFKHRLAKRGVVSYPEQIRLSAFANTEAVWSRAVRLDASLKDTFVSSIYEHFGMTRSEALTGKPSSGNIPIELESSGTPLHAVNPMYAPMFVDVASGYDSSSQKARLYGQKAVEQYFNDYDSNPSVAIELRQIMSKFGMDSDDSAARDQFKVSQMQATNRIMNQDYYEAANPMLVQGTPEEEAKLQQYIKWKQNNK